MGCCLSFKSISPVMIRFFPNCFPGVEKFLLMGFPAHALHVDAVSDSDKLACLLGYHDIAASSRNFSIPHHNAQVLGEMAGSATHCRPIAAALACVLKAGDCQCSNGGCLLLASAVACDLWLERLLPAASFLGCTSSNHLS